MCWAFSDSLRIWGVTYIFKEIETIKNEVNNRYRRSKQVDQRLSAKIQLEGGDS